MYKYSIIAVQYIIFAAFIIRVCDLTTKGNRLIWALMPLQVFYQGCIEFRSLNATNPDPVGVFFVGRVGG